MAAYHITGSETTPEIPNEERTTQHRMSLTGSYGRNRERTYASRNICQFVGQIICSGAGIIFTGDTQYSSCESGAVFTEISHFLVRKGLITGLIKIVSFEIFPHICRDVTVHRPSDRINVFYGADIR